MAVIPIELTILSSIPLRVWIVGLSRPFDLATHILHDSHALNELDIEVVFLDASAVSM